MIKIFITALLIVGMYANSAHATCTVVGKSEQRAIEKYAKECKSVRGYPCSLVEGEWWCSSEPIRKITISEYKAAHASPKKSVPKNTSPVKNTRPSSSAIKNSNNTQKHSGFTVMKALEYLAYGLLAIVAVIVGLIYLFFLIPVVIGLGAAALLVGGYPALGIIVGFIAFVVGCIIYSSDGVHISGTFKSD